MRCKWYCVRFMASTADTWHNLPCKVQLPQVQSCTIELSHLTEGTISNNRFTKVLCSTMASSQVPNPAWLQATWEIEHRKQASQKLRRWQEFLPSFDHTVVHTASKVNYIAATMTRNYIRTGTSSVEEDFFPDSIDEPTLHRTPILRTAPNTITWNHFSIPSLTLDMSEYQSCASDFSHTDCAYNLCRRGVNPSGHHYPCPYWDDDDWQQFVGYAVDS